RQHDMTSSESEIEQTSPRKKLRTSKHAESGGKGGKKARGRPRVDTTDATAADRRRTQIRLAQRAYRQRKETTISSLKQQSSQLHSIIEQMNKTFLRFNDYALKSGLLQLNIGLARELKHATETFTSLAKTASDLEAGDEYGEGIEQGVQPTRIAQEPRTASPAREAIEVGWGYSAIPNRTGGGTQSIPIETQSDDYFQNVNGFFSQASSTSLIPRRQFTVEEVWDQFKNSNAHYQPAATASHPRGSLPFGFVDILKQQTGSGPYTPLNPDIFPVCNPTPDITPPVTRLSTPPRPISSISHKTMAPVFTYSNDETTFARRLTRAAVETGFHALSSVDARPSALKHVFKLSLLYLTLDQLRERFKSILSRGVNEELDIWEIPFIQLGGAGTHYPRKDTNGNTLPRKNNWTVRQIEPLEKKMVRIESVEDGRWEYLHDMDLRNFEGEWFDAYDVQGYLEERWGFRVDHKSSFAECMVEDDGVSEFGRHSSDGSPSLTRSLSGNSTEGGEIIPYSITPPTTNAYSLPDSALGLDMSFGSPAFNSNNIDLSVDQTLGLDLAPGYDYGFSSDNVFNVFGLDIMGDVEVVPMQKKKKVAWVEVSKLIDDLLKHCVCLGQAPGFRCKDVDMAFQNALVSTE
ncbi:hypothetical protein BDU57DRAFT_454768, partial [Ampelomyces quisqualis]